MMVHRNYQVQSGFSARSLLAVKGLAILCCAFAASRSISKWIALLASIRDTYPLMYLQLLF